MRKSATASGTRRRGVARVLPLVAVAALSVPAALVSSAGPAAAAGGTFTATLEGIQEVPPNASPATGSATVVLDAAETTINVTVTFSGLLGQTTAAHIHAPGAPGVNAPVVIAFTGFPVGVTSGSYNASFAVTAGQVSDLRAGLSYVNIHTNLFPGGEIRGQLTEVLAPPTTLPPPADPVATSPRFTG